MKRIMVGIAVIVAILSTSVAWAYGPPEVQTVDDVGPYEGNFSGIAYGGSGSSAPLTLELTHRGSQVEGNVSLGEGLQVNAGFCGTFDIPAIDATIDGQTSARAPRRFEASPTFDAGAFELTIRDPVLTGVLLRD
jgi:hypothetical protein